VVFGDNVDEQMKPFHESGGEYQLTPLSIVASQIFKKDLTAFGDRELIKLIRHFVGERSPVVIVHPDQIEDGPNGEFFKDMMRADIDLVIAFDDKGKAHAVHRRTYESCKWDWYQVGGRWASFWLPKPGTVTQKYLDCDQNNNRAWMLRDKDYKPDNEYGRDTIRKGDIDIEKMIEKNLEPLMLDYREHHKHGKGHKTYSQLRRELIGDLHEPALKDWSNLSSAYWAQETVRRLIGEKVFLEPEDIDLMYTLSEEEYLQYHRDCGIAPFAYIHDGKWYECGQMGWFGTSSNNQSKDAWGRQFMEVLNSMSDDTMVSLVDCHI
jgi:hypothetical protein